MSIGQRRSITMCDNDECLPEQGHSARVDDVSRLILESDHTRSKPLWWGVNIRRSNINSVSVVNQYSKVISCTAFDIVYILFDGKLNYISASYRFMTCVSHISESQHHEVDSPIYCLRKLLQLPNGMPLALWGHQYSVWLGETIPHSRIMLIWQIIRDGYCIWWMPIFTSSIHYLYCWIVSCCWWNSSTYSKFFTDWFTKITIQKKNRLIT